VTNFLCALSGRAPENYEIAVRAGVWGVTEAMEARSDVGNRLRSVRIGDRVVLSLAGNFRSIHPIQSMPFIDSTPVWPEYDGSLFPHRVQIGHATHSGDVPIKDLAEQISFMRGKTWAGTIQGPHGVFNDRLTDDDVVLIQRRLSAERTPPPPPRAAPPRQATEQRRRQEALLTFYESDVETYLLDYLSGLGLRLFQCDGKSGRQYTCSAGRIDLLCVDTSSDFVVLELKKGEAPQESLLQLLRYMSWVRQNLANGKNVRGIIVTESTDAELRQIVGEVPNVSIQRYKVRLDFLND